MKLIFKLSALKIIPAILLSIIFNQSVYSQDRELDSLKTFISYSKDDTVKVKNLTDLATKYSNITPELAVHFANEAKTLAEKLQYKNGIAYALKVIGITFYNKSNYVEAINNWRQALDVFNSIGNKAGKANIESNLGSIYFNQGDDTKALQYYFSALKTAEQISDTLRMATTLNNIAALYQRKNNTQEKAIEYYKRSLPLSMQLQNNDLYGTTAVGLGETFLRKDSTSIDSALYYFNLSLKSVNGTIDESYTLNQLGKAYVKIEDFDKAIDLQKRALAIARKFESTDDIAISLVGLAQSYEKKGDSPNALNTFTEAEQVAKETNANYELQQIYNGLVNSYSKRKDYLNAFKYQLLLGSIKDTIYNSDLDKKLQDFQFTFDLEKKEGQINLLTKDAKIQEQEIHRQRMVKNSFVGGFAVVLFFAGIFFSQRNKISKEKKRSDELLLNILPTETAEELKQTGTAKTKRFEAVSVMFTDFKNFTQASELLSPEELVEEINYCYSEFDRIISKHGIEKIKTIGDSYMCAGGLPVPNTSHAEDCVNAGIEMQEFILRNKKERIANDKPYFDLRLGIHTGPVVAGIVGIKKFAYDIWGDTVNTASRMESSGEINKVNISSSTYDLIKNKFDCIYRGKVAAKNKGDIDMYFVEQCNTSNV